MNMVYLYIPQLRVLNRDLRLRERYEASLYAVKFVNEQDEIQYFIKKSRYTNHHDCLVNALEFEYIKRECPPYSIVYIVDLNAMSRAAMLMLRGEVLRELNRSD